MIYLGLGSNLGNRYNNILKGYKLLSNIGEIIKYSRVYESAALVCPDDNHPQPGYLNSAISFLTPLTPRELLVSIKEIEKEAGFRSSKKWGERHLDIDILCYNGDVIKTPELTIPHKEITKRAFASVPLFEVAGNITLPGFDNPLSFYIDRLDISCLKEYRPPKVKSSVST